MADTQHDELEGLRAENAALRARLALPPPAPPEPAEPKRRVVVILTLPDSQRPAAVSRERWDLRNIGIRNVADDIAQRQRQHHPEIDWRHEYDLERIPEGAICHYLGEVFRAVWRAEGDELEPPTAFQVVRDVHGRPRLELYGLPREAIWSRERRAVAPWAFDAGMNALRRNRVAGRDGVLSAFMGELAAHGEMRDRENLAEDRQRLGDPRWKEPLLRRPPEFMPRRISIGFDDDLMLEDKRARGLPLPPPNPPEYTKAHEAWMVAEEGPAKKAAEGRLMEVIERLAAEEGRLGGSPHDEPGGGANAG